MSGIFALPAANRARRRWSIRSCSSRRCRSVAGAHHRRQHPRAGRGKWIQNIGGLGAFLSVGLVLAAAGAAAYSGFGAHAPTLTGVSWEMATSFAVMCNALVGIELASTMGDEIRNPKRDLGPAIAIAGAVSIASYLLVTGAVLLLVPVDRLGVIQGIMQAVGAGANAAHIGWLVIPLAIVMGIATGGAASAWFAGSSRIPFVAGLTSALPPALDACTRGGIRRTSRSSPAPSSARSSRPCRSSAPALPSTRCCSRPQSSSS
jgi:hypothetical protein